MKRTIIICLLVWLQSAFVAVAANDGIEEGILYALRFNASENYLTIGESTVTIDTAIDMLTFEALGNGNYYIRDDEGRYMSYAGNDRWTMVASATIKDEWTVSVDAKGLYTLTGKNGGIGVDATDAGSPCYGDKKGTAVALWQIEKIIQEGEGDTSTVANMVALTSVQGHPGDEVEVQAMLTNEAAVTALEIQIPLYDALSYVDGSAALNADRSNGHVLSAAVVDGKLRIYIYSTSLTAIKGAEGLLCSFKLKLGKKPAVYSLIPKVILCDATGKAVESAGRSATVTLLAPQIEVATPQIDFGHIPIRSSYTQSLYIRNTGTEPLTISHIDLGCAELKASPTTCTIAAGITQEFVLTYSPVQWGAMETEVTITSDAINPKAGKAEVKADPYSVNELHVLPAEGASDSEVTVTLKMNNMEPIAAAQCSFVLPEGLVYVEGSASAGTRCNGTNHTVMGSVAGNKLTLYLYSMDNNTLPEGDGELLTFKLSLKGQDGWYYLNPENVILSNKDSKNMTSDISGEYVVIQSPIFSGSEEVKFAKTAVTQTATASYTIHNTGSENLVVSKVTFLAEGYMVKETLPLSIAAGASEDLTICYSPTGKGAHGTTMNIYTNDPNNRMVAVKLQGEVYEPNNITLRYYPEENGDYTYDIGLSNYTDVIAVQLDLHCPEGMTTTSNDATASERLKNHSFTIADMGNGVYRVLIYSFDNKAIIGNNGLLLTIPFSVTEGADATSVEIKNIVLSNSEGTNCISPEGEWEEITDKIVNADFSSRGNGWSGTEFTAANGYVAEQWNKTFDNYQILAGMKAGRYRLTCQGFYRYGSIDHAKTNYQNGTEQLNGILYMNEAEQPFVSIYSEDYYMLDPYNYPDNVTQANTAFNSYGLYTGNMVEYRLKEDGDLKIGMKKHVAVDADWVIFDNFKLYYYNVTNPAVVYLVSTIQLNKQNITLETGDSTMITATLIPVDVMDDKVVWSSSDTTVVSVDAEGRIIAIAPGEAIITATANDGGGANTSCEVRVIKPRRRVTFVIDGEVYSTDSLDCGDSIILPDTPTKEGHTFSGWSEVPETMPANDVTISGTFSISKYIVTFKIGDDVVVADSLEYGSVIVAPEAPDKEGHTFNGWGEVAEIVPANDLTYEGSYSVNTYLLTYTIDGDLVQVDSVVYGTEITVLAEPTKEGHTFSGWIEIPETMPAKDVTITGSFTVNSYTLTYIVDDVEYKKETVAYGTKLTALEAPTKEGHTFSGWSEIPETMPANDVTVTGAFTVNSYLLSYTVDGETVQADSVVYGTAIILLEEPTKEGHTFSGWSEAPETMPDNDVVVSGTFTINKYLVTFMIGDEVIAADSLEYGATIVAPEAPEKEGYTFDGWGEVAETVPAGDVTYEGTYTVNIYKVYYYVGEELVHTAEVAYGETIPEYVYEPTEEGYTFLGWVGETYETMPAHDVTYTANIGDGIEHSSLNPQRSTIYDLTGRKILNTENLKGGIYIVNGKKVVIK